MRTVETKEIMFAVLAAALVATLGSIMQIEPASAHHQDGHDRGCETKNTCGLDEDDGELAEEIKEAEDKEAEAEEPGPGECCD